MASGKPTPGLTARVKKRCGLSKPAIVAGLAALVWCGGATAARAETLTLGYLVGWGHVTLAEAEISFSQTDARYRLAGTGRTRFL